MADLWPQKIWLNLKNFLFQRVFFLLVVMVALFYLAIDHSVLKIKTLNFLLPPVEYMKEFNEHPDQMDQKKLTDIFIYYKKVCDFAAHDPEEPAPCSVAGYASYYLGKKKQAIRYYKNAIRGNDAFFWFYYNLGAIYYNEGRYTEAAENFARALSVPLPNSMYFFMLTKTYKDFTAVLNLVAEDYEVSLVQGYESASKLYSFSHMIAEDPSQKSQFIIQKIKLRLF